MTLASEIRSDARSTWPGYLVASLLVAVATASAAGMEATGDIPNLSLVFVLPVVIAALAWGFGPGLTAAVLGVASYNFFLISPRYTFEVDDPSNVWALLLLLVVAGLVSFVGGEARRRAISALRHADQALALQDLARTLVAAPDHAGMMVAANRALERAFQAPAVTLDGTGDAVTLAAASEAIALGPADMDAARWALASRLPIRAGTYPHEQASFDYWPIVTPSRLQAVVGVRFAEGRPEGAEPLIEIITGHLAVALERERFAAQALSARLEVEGERMKSDLLAAVSHDLRTPLSTILFSIQSLRKFADTHDAATRDQLLDLASAETERLSGLVDKLLDMSRIDSGGVVVQRVDCDLAEIVSGALEHAGLALTGHSLVTSLTETPMRAHVDPVLCESALANVLENAAKYSPEGSRISLTLSRRDDWAVIEVCDEGPGFGEPVARMFEKFTRGVETDGRAPGVGLGLAIARGFLLAQGGRIEAGNQDGSAGAWVRISLPLEAHT